MAFARVTLESVKYPETSDNSLIVLQSLEAAGYRIILGKGCKDKRTVAEYFSDRNITVSFKDMDSPDIDIMDTQARIGAECVSGTADTIWEEIDKVCLLRQVYDRNPIDEYIPSYKPGTYFLVLDYGLPSQLVDSVPVTLRGTHTKAGHIVRARPSIKSVDVVNSTTWKMEEHYRMADFSFIPYDDDVFFSIFV